MRSPFPGMDPYIEYRWKNVHVTLMSSIQALLQGHMPPGLRARTETDVLIEEASGVERQRFGADVAIVERFPSVADSSTTAVMEAPVVVQLEPSSHKHRWVQIIDTRDGNRVVTVIEVLIPGNKASGDLNKS